MSEEEREQLPEELTEEEWLEKRKRGLGGTDVAAIAGVHPWRSPFDVYREKMGLADPTPPSINMMYGAAVEPFVLDQYARETGQRVIRLGRRLFRHADVNIWQGTPDGIVPLPGPGVEAKTVGFAHRASWGLEAGSDAVPEWVRCQVTWYMPLLHRDVVDVAAWFSGAEFLMYRVRREEELVGVLAEAAQRFWRDHIVAEFPPPLDASRAAEEYLKKMYPVNKALSPRLATPEEEQLLMDLWRARTQTTEAEILEKVIENQVKAAIADSPGVESGRFRALWKLTKDSEGTDWEAVARELGASEEVIARHRKVRAGVRRFTFNVKE